MRDERPGDRRLVAYVVAGEGQEADVAGLRAHAAARLPDYMVPSAFVVLDALPLTVNGKVDRLALPAPDYGAGAGVYVAPRTAQEEILAGLWADVLEVDRVGVRDSFFDLGGHSLLALRLLSRVSDVLGAQVPIRDFFAGPTVAAMAGLIASAANGRPPALTALPRPEPMPLSFAQRRLWFIGQLEGGTPTYNIPVAVRVSGALDAAALRASLADVARRHEALRTVFPGPGGVPFQRVLEGDAACPVLEEVAVTEETLAGAVTAAAAHPFDLTAELPVRAWLLSLSPDEHVLLVVLHHICGDGWSMDPLRRDLAAAYRARRTGVAPGWEPLPVQYADYTLWQRAVLGDENDPGSLAWRQEAFWRAALAGLPEELPLPADRRRPAVATYRGGTVHFDVPAAVHAGLARVARHCGATLFMVVQAAVAALLSRLGAGHDIPVGTPVAGRTAEALDDLVGFFVNMLVLRTDTAGNPRFAELVARVRETDLAAFQHQDVPFERLVEVLNPDRSLSRHPLFQVAVTVDSDGASEGPGLVLPGVACEPVPIALDVAKFDLMFTLVERRAAGEPAGLDGRLGFATDLFGAETAGAIAGRLTGVLAAVSADPSVRIEQIEILAPAERDQLLRQWNDTVTAVPAGHLSDLFEAQATRSPDAVAVRCQGRQVTYRQLSACSSRLARYLIEAGAGPDQVVAIALPRTEPMVIALLAVLKAGAAYLPVEPSYPARRIAFMLEDARPPIVLTDAGTRAWLPAAARCVALDSGGAGLDLAGRPDHPVSDAERRYPLRPDHPAYVIYTSGSTGAPKGVVVTQRSLVRVARWTANDFPPGALAQVLAATSLSFDFSVHEIFGPLCAGGCIEVVDNLLALADRNGRAWTSGLISAVPSAFTELASTGRTRVSGGMLALAGEPLSDHLAQEIRSAAPGCALANIYGPTEAAYVTASLADAPPAAPPIGRPTANTRLYVLDDRLRLVPPGVPGELYVAGASLARGYLGRPGLTGSRFVACPFEDSGQRMYRTGDVVRWTARGELGFIGRSDDQVKIRGIRVEPGEVEEVLAQHPSCGRVVVAVRDERPGDRRLVAYVVAGEGREADVAGLRAHAAARLPDYMVPSAFVVLDALPLTVNGKVDRLALPAPDYGAGAGVYVAPRTAQEEILAGLWADVLEVDRVGVRDSFFDLGGHSLLALRLLSRVSDVLGAQVPIRDFFAGPTVAAMGALMADSTAGRLPSAHGVPASG